MYALDDFPKPVVQNSSAKHYYYYETGAYL